jgi:hypothetical protein
MPGARLDEQRRGLAFALPTGADGDELSAPFHGGAGGYQYQAMTVTIGPECEEKRLLDACCWHCHSKISDGRARR